MKARGCGYQFPAECELCGAPTDSISHRLWMCPKLQALRSEVVGQELLDSLFDYVTSPDKLFV
eukprot:7199634-Pyramimonas_sp.AAC.1